MKRVLSVALTACLWTGIAGGLPNTYANARLDASTSVESKQANQQEMREKQCRYQWKDPGTWTAREERLTALCVLERWSVPGGWTQLNSTIGCESGWRRDAYNPAGPYVGLGQHALSAWPYRVRSYSPPLWGLHPQWRNSRTMLTVTIRMMHAVGTSPWTCA